MITQVLFLIFQNTALPIVLLQETALSLGAATIYISYNTFGIVRGLINKK